MWQPRGKAGRGVGGEAREPGGREQPVVEEVEGAPQVLQHSGGIAGERRRRVVPAAGDSVQHLGSDHVTRGCGDVTDVTGGGVERHRGPGCGPDQDQSHRRVDHEPDPVLTERDRALGDGRDAVGADGQPRGDRRTHVAGVPLIADSEPQPSVRRRGVLDRHRGAEGPAPGRTGGDERCQAVQQGYGRPNGVVLPPRDALAKPGSRVEEQAHRGQRGPPAHCVGSAQDPYQLQRLFQARATR